VFRHLSEDVAASLPTDHPGEAELELATNYRSEPALITFFNDLFPRVFGTPTEEYEAEFSPLLSRPADEDVTPAVTVAWVPAPADAEARASTDESDEPGYVNGTYAEGAWIAAEIADLIERGAYGPGDIAILLRSSSGQQMFERMLRRQGIAYQTQAVRSLFTEAPAHDIYALLQLVYFPTDREALTAYLRSPLVMLSDDALIRVLQAPAEDGLFASPAEIGAQEAEKLRAAAQLYDAVAAAVDRVPVHEVIRRIWDEGGYRYAILHRAGDHSYLEHYDYLFSLALQ
jgi:ATP-dependent exoDNAse (exonuclease V) beta subunit